MNDALQPESGNAYEQFLAAWLTNAPAELAVLARYAALPHTFDLALLSHLVTGAGNVEEGLVRLRQAALVEEQEDGRFAFQPLLRPLLLARWQREDLAAYRQAHQRAAGYLAAAPESDETTVAYLYHLLVADEARGLVAVRQAVGAELNRPELDQVSLLLDFAAEHETLYRPDTQQWLRYLEAHYQITIYQFEAAAAGLTDLQATELPTDLRGWVHLRLGETFLASHEWPAAFAQFDEAAEIFDGQQNTAAVGGVWEIRGLAYLRLASHLGGLSDTAVSESAYRSWWQTYRHAPFLLYRQLSRWISLLPNLYFGSNYQDWIIVRLLRAAVKALEQAQKNTLAETEGRVERLLRLDIVLADLYQRLNRWSKAARLRQSLSRQDVVYNNPSLLAALQLVRGRAALTRRRWAEADSALSAAYDAYTRFADRENAGQTAALLAQLAYQQGANETAVSYTAIAARHARATNDLLTATQLWHWLDERIAPSQRTTSIQQQLDTLSETLAQRAYIARFPGQLRRRFRALALFVALPLAYALAHVLRFLLIVTVGIVDLNVQAGLTAALPLVELASTFFMMVIMLTTTVWAYEGVYVLFGRLFVQLLHPANLAMQQPVYTILLEEGLILRTEEGNVFELPWAQIESFLSVNRCFWKRPLSLLSQLFLSSATTSLRLDGILTNYEPLQRSIAERLRQTTSAIRMRHLDHSLLNSWETVLASILAAGLTIVELFGWLDPNREPVLISVARPGESEYLLVVTTLLFLLFRWGLFIIPFFTLLRLMWQQRQARQLMGQTAVFDATWPLLLAIILLTLAIAVNVWQLGA